MSQRGVIFDMDGVLIDSYRAHFASWRTLYGELGISYDEQQFAADFGRTSRDILGRKFGATLSENRICELDERKESLFREILRQEFPVMPGAVELIDALSEAGFLLAVGSSGPAENIAVSLAGLGRAEKFSSLVTGSDVTRGKPDPQVFQLAAQRLGLSAEFCAVIEDAIHGVEAAHRAGMACIALTGTATREQLAAADLVVESLCELSPSIVGSLINRKCGTG